MNIKTVDIKGNSEGQAISIPHEMRINDDKVYIKRVGNALYVIPFHSPWHNLIEGVNSFSDDFFCNYYL